MAVRVIAKDLAGNDVERILVEPAELNQRIEEITPGLIVTINNQVEANLVNNSSTINSLIQDKTNVALNTLSSELQDDIAELKNTTSNHGTSISSINSTLSTTDGQIVSLDKKIDDEISNIRGGDNTSTLASLNASCNGLDQRLTKEIAAEQAALANEITDRQTGDKELEGRINTTIKGINDTLSDIMAYGRNNETGEVYFRSLVTLTEKADELVRTVTTVVVEDEKEKTVSKDVGRIPDIEARVTNNEQDISSNKTSISNLQDWKNEFDKGLYLKTADYISNYHNSITTKISNESDNRQKADAAIYGKIGTIAEGKTVGGLITNLEDKLDDHDDRLTNIEAFFADDKTESVLDTLEDIKDLIDTNGDIPKAIANNTEVINSNKEEFDKYVLDHTYNDTTIETKIDEAKNEVMSNIRQTRTFVNIESLDDIADETDLATGDIAIVRTPIQNSDKYSYTSYVYSKLAEDTYAWAAMDGNYNANNVYFDNDFVFTTKIGTVDTLVNGNATVAAKGKSLQQFLAGLFAKELNPSRKSVPTVSWSTKPENLVEVGDEITPTFGVSLSAGSYTYGPATGITAKTWTVDIADRSDSNITSNSGSFSKFTATDGMNGYAKVTATATYDTGAIPVTNIGNNYDENGAKSVRFMASSASATSAGYTAYRAWFCGYKKGTEKIAIADIDSAKIRALTPANGFFTSSMETEKMQQMFFAAPAGLIKSLEIKEAGNNAPQTVKQTTVFVKGKNNYALDVEEAQNADNNKNGMKYDLFYVDNDGANLGKATYNITYTLN